MLKLLIFVAVLGIAFAFPQTDNQNQPAGVKDVDLEGRFGGIGHQHHGGHQPHGQQQFGHGYGQQGYGGHHGGQGHGYPGQYGHQGFVG